MAALRGTKVIRVGSSGIPAYDSLEEITSPTEGMVVKINGQEGEDRGVLAGDVLGVVTWAAAPNILAYSYENAVPITLLTFTDGTEIYTLYNELMEEPYTIDFAVYHGEQNANPIASLAFNEGYNPPASWNASSYNFGGRTVQAINDNSIQNAIKVQSPALPDKYYIYDEGWVEMVDVSATTAEEADVLDGEIFYKADGTQSEGTLVPLDISDSNAAVGDVVASKTFYATSGGKKTGTMTDRGTVSTDITTKAQEVTIAAGKHSGSGKVKISATEQAKIIAGNIKKDITLLGVTGTLEGGVPLEQFVQFDTDHSGSMWGTRLLTFFSRNPRGWDTRVNTEIYYKDATETEVLLVSKYISFDTVNFIAIPRSYGTLKIVMSLVPDFDYGWNGFSGFYAKDAAPNVVTQLTPPSFQDDFVLSYVDFDVFHVVFTAYGE